MAEKLHHYQVVLEWQGNLGVGTRDYRSYAREFTVKGKAGKTLAGSADPAFLGQESSWNPEELLLASISACHQLWYLHLCADAGLCVMKYSDNPVATMDENSGRFVSAQLRPEVTLAPESDPEFALSLHELAHSKCYIANSLAFAISVKPAVSTMPPA
ncbi:peroxiredoxin [Lonsdalea populi]|uniref:OsmC family peroxiredoxin n=1 Tax=Lonsdalea populi TaxID=1172565 RepID=A0A3N0UAD4_9GAMM|nr:MULTISPECIES: OsmC family protein [Lonsdalea]OSM94389.1 peroxiredoxin [Lonsdalea populi]OSM94733.1 peroxiredoxin [Lonsdalea populi]QPQ24892.1 OsmC family protein [Lonsdalea populi]RAT13420.1 peroxiredoxin [Lonsdalea quercina]RAT27899.1 peroxiredoxin [Lonsdalea populi]